MKSNKISTIKSHYLRWRISQPDYYYDRAIMMGEAKGAFDAEATSLRYQNRNQEANKKLQMMLMFHRRMNWYARKMYVYNAEDLDYNT